MRFAPGCFWSPYSRPTQKMADLGLLGKFVITRLLGHLWRRSLQQKLPLWLHFKCLQIRRWCDLRQGFFEARIVGPLFWAFSLGPPLAKSQKMADFGLLGKFVITRLHGHLWMRSLQQNVPLWLHLKCILIRRSCDLRQGVFEARIVGYSENGRLMSPWQICLQLGSTGTDGGAVCNKMFLYDCTSSAYKLGDEAICAREFVKPV